MPRIGLDARKLNDGGIGRYVTELLHAYPSMVRDEEVVVFGHPRDLGPVRRLAPDFEFVPVSAPGYSLREQIELGWQASRAGLDLLHVPHYVIPLAARVPMAVTVHDLVHWRYPRTRWHALFCQRMIAAVKRRACLVLTPARAVARDLAELAGIEEGRIRSIPNGLSPIFLAELTPEQAGTETEAFLRRLHVRRPYALNVTNGLPHKGLDLLLAAFRELPGLTLVLAGKGSDRPEVYQQIDAAGLPQGTVVVLGAVSDRELRLAYSASALVVVASRLEGFGLPALEGMAAGTPVIASNSGGLPEVVGDAGILFPPDSVAHLRAALYRVAFGLERTERERLIDGARVRARQFSWEKTARSTLAAYQRALEGEG